jgi:GMP synthase-like glutamine amidotransferase
MHIAILMTNTDESAFAQAHPGDGEKFAQLLGPLRPDWQFSVFSVKDGVFPAGLDGIDGVIITGSPASVHDADAWVGRLLGLIRQIVDTGLPLFGACFGHQAIALALGGEVTLNPGGWVLGSVATEMEGLGPLRLYAAHLEQVTRLPVGARVIGTTPGCPVAAIAIGVRVMTTQYHPEMTPAFIAALTDELTGKLPDDVTALARPSLREEADTVRMAAHMVAFLEAADQDRAASKSIAVT